MRCFRNMRMVLGFDPLWLLTAAFQCARVVYNQQKALARAGLVSHLVGHVYVILWKGGKYDNTEVTCLV